MGFVNYFLEVVLVAAFVGQFIRLAIFGNASVDVVYKNLGKGKY
jgi:hypothetical protein